MVNVEVITEAQKSEESSGVPEIARGDDLGQETETFFLAGGHQINVLAFPAEAALILLQCTLEKQLS